jgi:hypothetical protein
MKVLVTPTSRDRPDLFKAHFYEGEIESITPMGAIPTNLIMIVIHYPTDKTVDLGPRTKFMTYNYKTKDELTGQQKKLVIQTMFEGRIE